MNLYTVSVGLVFHPTALHDATHADQRVAPGNSSTHCEAEGSASASALPQATAQRIANLKASGIPFLGTPQSWSPVQQ